MATENSALQQGKISRCQQVNGARLLVLRWEVGLAAARLHGRYSVQSHADRCAARSGGQRGRGPKLARHPVMRAQPQAASGSPEERLPVQLIWLLSRVADLGIPVARADACSDLHRPPSWMASIESFDISCLDSSRIGSASTTTPDKASPHIDWLCSVASVG